MDQNQKALYAAIQSFQIDDGDPALTFEARLARDNGWSATYARRVTAEYRRYVFLAVASGESVCPSEDVDAAWHLHLTHTRSYWTRFCGEVLSRPLHHEPTKGGPAEADKHRQMYARTLELYQQFFDAQPPADIWPPVDVRFGPDLDRVVVNTARNWIVPKKAVGSILLFAVVAAATVVLQTWLGRFNPFDLVGRAFFTFLIPALITAVVVARMLRSSLSHPGPQPADEDLDFDWQQTAFLVGGLPRLTSAAIAALVARGVARVSDDKKHILPGDREPGGDLTETEAAVYGSLPLNNKREDLATLQLVVDKAYAREADRLSDAGLVLSPERQAEVLFWSLIPVLVVVALFGLPRLFLGLATHRPVGLLVLTLFVGGIVGLLLSAAGDRRLTRRGRSVVQRHRSRHGSLRLQPALDGHDEAGLAVALFGTTVLAHSSLSPLAAWYPRPTAHTAAGGCGTGCSAGGGCGGGGGGCGGGGCGGCG